MKIINNSITSPFGSATADEAKSPAGRERPSPVATVYDELDRRLIDTFPASDAIARY